MFFGIFLGFVPNCPGKIVSVFKKWTGLLLWLPGWLSVLLAVPVRFLSLIVYFFWVTFGQFIALISDFFIGIKNWFDSFFFGDLYHGIKFLWNNPFVFYLVWGIPLFALLLLWGMWWVFLFFFQVTIDFIRFFDVFFWSSWWWWYSLFFHNNGVFYGPTYWVMWIPNMMFWLYQSLMHIIFGFMDDICWGFWDILDDFADQMLDVFEFPTW